MIRFHVVNPWDEDDELFGNARPSIPLCEFTEEIKALTNERLANFRPSAAVMDDFRTFIDWRGVGREKSGI